MQNTLIIVIGFVVLILVLLALFTYGDNKQKPPPSATPLPPAKLPVPARPPWSTPTWSQRGNWSVPFRVRYAVAFTRGNRIGPMSCWAPWLKSVEFSNPILSKFPVDPTQQATGIALFRQFEGSSPSIIAHLPHPYLLRYTDNKADIV